MKVGTLREMLEGLDDDMTVMIAQQPSWPLASSVRNVVPADERELDDDDELEDDASDPRSRKDIVWIVAGVASEYAPRDVFQL